jgi:hypothetical protein
LLVLAGSSDKPSHGGTGGSSFRQDCGDDEVLIGVTWWGTNWVNGLVPSCSRISTNSWVAGAYEDGGPPLAGRAPGFSWGDFGKETPEEKRWSVAKCPRNTVVVGISGSYGWYVNRLRLRCRPLEGMVSGTTSYSFVTGSTSSIYVSSTEAGDHSFNYESCPDNKPARGFHGREGNYVDRIGLICHTGATPKLHVYAAPSEPWFIGDARELRWTDQSTEEQKFSVVISGPLPPQPSNRKVPQRTFDVSASAGVGQNINWVIPPDLAQGEYSVRVCARFAPFSQGAFSAGGDQCTAARRFRF